MPMLISRATGNFTSASTWGVADSATGSQLTNPSVFINISTAVVYSPAFTGTNGKIADGIALFGKRNNTTGTITVILSDDNGVTPTRSVTVNASDLPPDESWIFFKFGSPLTLDGGTDYKVGLTSSSAANGIFGRDSTTGNWARLISTTDTAAPAAGDTMLILGEWTGAGAGSSYTVTMDNTATTDFGSGTATAAPTPTNPQAFTGIQIGQNGTLSWGTSAATNYYLKLSGNLVVWSGGTYNMGTVANPCPRGSTMYLQFDCVADGDFGLLFFNGATSTIQGLSRTSGKDVWYCQLNTDEAAGSTSLGVDTDTGWLDNDRIAIAQTDYPFGAARCEDGLLNGNAGTNTLTVDGFAGAGGGLAFPHTGTGQVKAHIILLTRSISISGASSTLMSYVYIGGSSTHDWDWAEFYWLGTNSTGKRGISFGNSGTYTGTFNMQYCSIYRTEYALFDFSSSVSQSSGSSVTFSNNGMYRGQNICADISCHSGTGTFVFSGNIALQSLGSFAAVIYHRNGTVTNNVAVGGNGDNFTSNFSSLPTDNFSGNIAYGSFRGGNFGLSGEGTARTYTNCYSYRSFAGFMLSSNRLVLTATGTQIYGCNFGIRFPSSSNFFPTLFLDNCQISGETGFGTGTAVECGFGGALYFINNCSFSVATGGLTACTSDLVLNTSGSFSYLRIYLNNTLLGSSTEVSGSSGMGPYDFIVSSKHDRTEGAFKSWFKYGIIERDTTIFNTAAPSERLTPNNASNKLASGSRIVAVDDGTTVTVSVYVRKSATGDGAAYNGNQPRLVVKANPSVGITTDTVLDTMTVGTGTWELLTGTTASVDADGGLEFFVDCDGTAGWINVDDWTVS